jgi:prepilin-type N-terminal cleavage/methylation domain-containing protein
MQHPKSRGFTVVELMVVVVIVTILATLAAKTYTRFTARARVTEVYAMFAEMRAKEESYRAEFTSYLSVSNSDTDFYPVLGSAGGEPAAKTWAPTNTNWASLGVNPPRSQLYCSYSLTAGPPNQWNTVADTNTRTFLGGSPPQVNWWVAVGMCDNDGVAGTLDNGLNATYITSSRTTVVTEANPSR